MARRFFIKQFPSFVKGGVLELGGQQHNHLKKVLRLKVNSTVEVFDSNGLNGIAKIIEINKDETVLKLETINNNENSDIDSNSNINNNNNYNNESSITILPKIDLATSLPKLARAEWMIEKLSEIGIRNLFLLETEFSKSSPQSGSLTDNKLDRFERIIIESSKQSRNDQIMKIIPPISINQFLKDKFLNQKDGDSKWGHVFLGDPYQGKELPLIVNDIINGNESNNKSKLNKDILLFIGSEGGFTEKEISNIKIVLNKRTDSKLHLSKFGKNILRMETAAILSSGYLSLNLPFFNKK